MNDKVAIRKTFASLIPPTSWAPPIHVAMGGHGSPDGNLVILINEIHKYD